MSKRRRKEKLILDEFKEGDLVGAKVKGYPLWPGYIQKVDYINKKPRYEVRFFGTDDISRACIHIKPFKCFTAQEKACNRKGFSQALSICQEKYEEITVTDSDKHLTPQIPSIASSPAEKSPNSVQEVNEVSEPDSIKTKPESSLPLTDCDPDPKRNENENENEIADDDSIKSDDGNVSSRDLVLEKLKGKVREKLEEKKACKEEYRKRKASSKASNKIVVVNKKLISTYNVLKKLATADKVGKSTLSEWRAAVRNFESAIPVLIKCTKLLSDQFKDSSDFKSCRDVLSNLKEHIKAAKKNSRLPQDVKDDLKKIRNSMKNNVFLRKFVNEFDIGDDDYAMTERKENGVRSS